ncbi:MAG TPA: hypothetical protein VHO06_19790 [Polyangia bacterium]|nr:hypothetical protein [Polyangia bacterium]
MSSEIAAVDARAARALRRRRDLARVNGAPFDWLINSTSASSIVSLAKRFATIPTSPILIQGERGCGVQALARLVHDEDPAASGGRFRSVPAAFVSPAEMRGWFTHGTLVVEDLEDLKTAGQSWVAETLSARSGDRHALRIIATSRLGVGELLLRRHLSQELVHALDVFRLVVPPLRERPGDVLPIARAFLRHYGEAVGCPFLRFSAEAEAALAAHPYPANVCELRNVVERAVALRKRDDGELPAETVVFYEARRPGDVAGGAVAPPAARPAGGGAPFPTLAEVERAYLTTLIRELHGRRTEIARAMGVSYPTVLKKIARHRLDVRAIMATGLDEEASAP